MSLWTLFVEELYCGSKAPSWCGGIDTHEVSEGRKKGLYGRRKKLESETKWLGKEKRCKIVRKLVSKNSWMRELKSSLAKRSPYCKNVRKVEKWGQWKVLWFHNVVDTHPVSKGWPISGVVVPKRGRLYREPRGWPSLGSKLLIPMRCWGSKIG